MSIAYSPSATAIKPSIGTIWRNGITAALIAAVVNVILFFVGQALNAFPSTVITPMGQPITVGPVAIVTILSILVGTLGYTILSRLTANSNRWFTIIAAVVLIGMAITPFTLPGAPVLMIVILELMHLVAGGTAIYFLTRS